MCGVCSEESCSTTVKEISHNEGTYVNESSQDNVDHSKVSSQVDQSTQTEALPTSLQLTSMIPDHLLQKMKSEVPWLINIYDAIDNKLHDLDVKVSNNTVQTSSNRAKIEEDNQ